MAYEFVCESEAKRYRSDCSNVLKKTCELLKEKGISAQRIQLQANSKTDLYQQCSGMQRDRKTIDCMAPNRRVNIQW